MRSKVFFHLLFLFFIVAGLVLVLVYREAIGRQEETARGGGHKVCCRGECFYVEVADNSEERRLGLMGRAKLPSNRGMLFVFEVEERHSIWMKNTLIPLDIIWLNSDGEIVEVKQGVLPCHPGTYCPIYTPAVPARYILELNGGLSERRNLRKSVHCEIDPLRDPL